MALMEWGCNHQAFGRDVQPAITNSPTHLLTKTIRQTNCAMLCYAMLYYAMRNSKARAIALHTHTHTHTPKQRHQNKHTENTWHNSHVPLPIAHNTIINIIVCQLPHSLRVKGCYTFSSITLNNFRLNCIDLINNCIK